MGWIRPHIFDSFQALDEHRIKTGQSLGFIRPINPVLEIVPEETAEWSEKEKSNLVKESLFDEDSVKNRPMLRKVPYGFYYSYQCSTPEGLVTLRHKITDWEAGMLYWNCIRSHQANWRVPFEQKLGIEFPKKDLIFMMGTIHRFPDQWLIIDLIYPPKPKQVKGKAEQLALDLPT